MKTIAVSGKCSDLCYFSVSDADRNTILYVDGQLPSGIGVGGGDYLEVTIDIETGQLVGWNSARVKEMIQQYIDRRSKLLMPNG